MPVLKGLDKRDRKNSIGDMFCLINAEPHCITGAPGSMDLVNFLKIRILNSEYLFALIWLRKDESDFLYNLIFSGRIKIELA
jgi:hypothetical protein